MPLNVATLAKGLAGVFKDQPDNGALAASKIAQEYDTYCKEAMAGAALPIFTTTEKTRMEGILAGALSSSNGQAAMVAQAFSAAIQSYWLMPPVQFSGGPIMGMVTVMPGAAAVIPAITAGLSNVQNMEDSIGQIIASALDAATKTVLVTFTTPPPPAGPPPPAKVT